MLEPEEIEFLQEKNDEISRLKAKIENLKEKLKMHCEYDEKLGWYLPERKIDLIFSLVDKGEYNEN